MNRQKKRKFIYHCEKYCVIGYYLSLCCRVGMAGVVIEGRCIPTPRPYCRWASLYRNKAVSFFLVDELSIFWLCSR